MPNLPDRPGPRLSRREFLKVAATTAAGAIAAACGAPPPPDVKPTVSPPAPATPGQKDTPTVSPAETQKPLPDTPTIVKATFTSTPEPSRTPTPALPEVRITVAPNIGGTELLKPGELEGVTTAMGEQLEKAGRFLEIYFGATEEDKKLRMQLLMAEPSGLEGVKSLAVEIKPEVAPALPGKAAVVTIARDEQERVRLIGVWQDTPGWIDEKNQIPRGAFLFYLSQCPWQTGDPNAGEPQWDETLGTIIYVNAKGETTCHADLAANNIVLGAPARPTPTSTPTPEPTATPTRNPELWWQDFKFFGYEPNSKIELILGDRKVTLVVTKGLAQREKNPIKEIELNTVQVPDAKERLQRVLERNIQVALNNQGSKDGKIRVKGVVPIGEGASWQEFTVDTKDTNKPIIIVLSDKEGWVKLSTSSSWHFFLIPEGGLGIHLFNGSNNPDYWRGTLLRGINSFRKAPNQLVGYIDIPNSPLDQKDIADLTNGILVVR